MAEIEVIRKIDEILAENPGKYVAVSADLKQVFPDHTPEKARRKAIANGIHAPIVLYGPSKKDD